MAGRRKTHMKTLATAAAALLLSFALWSPASVSAQGACESAATGGVALAAGPAVGALGNAVSGVFDRADAHPDHVLGGPAGEDAPVAPPAQNPPRQGTQAGSGPAPVVS